MKKSVVSHVKVSFTSTDWSLAKDGMNKLLSERDNISRQDIFQIIQDINKNVFCKHVIFVDDDGHDDDAYDQEKEEKEYFNTFNQVIFYFVSCFCLRIYCNHNNLQRQICVANVTRINW